MTNIRELYNNLIVKLILITKDVLVLEPKHSIVEYGRSHRSNIKFVEGGAENIPLPDEYFDKVVASASFHHFSDQDKALEEMKRVLKPDGKIIILEIDPNTPRGKRLFCETLFHTGAKYTSQHSRVKKLKNTICKYCLLILLT